MAFEITMVLTGPVAEITLSGDLDASSAPRFQQQLETAAASKPAELVLHVRDLLFIASVGIRMLVFAKRALFGAGLTVYMIAPQEQVLDTLRRTGLHHSVVILEEYPPAE